MTPHTTSPFDLRRRARQAMQDEGFEPEFPPAAIHQAQAARDSHTLPPADGPVRDLRSRLWSSIDNRESLDLDQIEVAERLPNGAIRICVGIADVDTLAPIQSPVDLHAAQNTISVYTGVVTFPMLPDPLSTDATSLLEAADRLAVVTEMTVEADGRVSSQALYPALVRNHARLDYESVGAWLEQGGPPPASLARLPGLEEQIHLQHEAARRLLALRRQQGALEFETIEAVPVVENGHVVDVTVPQRNQARLIIENLMIAANTAQATYLESTGLPSIQRVVRSPERWPRIVEIARQLGEALPAEPDAPALAAFLDRRKAADPEHFPDLCLAVVKLLGPGEYLVVRPGDTAGHFALAAYRYTHATAPNRRYADLVIQRLVKAVLARQAPPYTEAELQQVARHCTEREAAARKVERVMRKVAAAVLFSGRIGEVFEAIVTGVSPKGTYARVTAPPVEGRVVRGEQGMDVGDRVRVRLIATDPERGYIDFAGVGR